MPFLLYKCYISKCPYCSRRLFNACSAHTLGDSFLKISRYPHSSAAFNVEFTFLSFSLFRTLCFIILHYLAKFLCSQAILFLYFVYFLGVCSKGLHFFACYDQNHFPMTFAKRYSIEAWTGYSNLLIMHNNKLLNNLKNFFI